MCEFIYYSREELQTVHSRESKSKPVTYQQDATDRETDPHQVQVC